MKVSQFSRCATMILLPLVLSCAAPPRSPGAGAPSMQFLNSPEMDALDFPFSEVVRVGHTLYLSGQVGIRPGSSILAPGGIAGETKQVLENIQDVLERNGSSLDRVAKCTVFLADIAEWSAMNDVYRTFFPENPPARSALGASGLALGARVEIECLAIVDEAAAR